MRLDLLHTLKKRTMKNELLQKDIDSLQVRDVVEYRNYENSDVKRRCVRPQSSTKKQRYR